jgi:hypothetical protein
LIILAQALMASPALVFIIVGGRTGPGFLPLRDASFFIDHVERVSPAT